MSKAVWGRTRRSHVRGGGLGPGVPVLHSEVPGPGSGMGAGTEKVPVW